MFCSFSSPFTSSRTHRKCQRRPRHDHMVLLRVTVVRFPATRPLVPSPLAPTLGPLFFRTTSVSPPRWLSPSLPPARTTLAPSLVACTIELALEVAMVLGAGRSDLAHAPSFEGWCGPRVDPRDWGPSTFGCLDIFVSYCSFVSFFSFIISVPFLFPPFSSSRDLSAAPAARSCYSDTFLNDAYRLAHSPFDFTVGSFCTLALAHQLQFPATMMETLSSTRSSITCVGCSFRQLLWRHRLPCPAASRLPHQSRSSSSFSHHQFQHLARDPWREGVDLRRTIGILDLHLRVLVCF